MKKILIIAAGISTLIGILFFFYVKEKGLTISISQEKIDTELSKHFPATKNYLLLLDLTYSNPKVTLLEGKNRVQIGLDVTLTNGFHRKSRSYQGGATVTTGIRYDPKKQAFYLSDSTFDRLEIADLSKKWLNRAREIAPIAAKEFLEDKPIYEIEGKDAKTRAAKRFLKNLETYDQAIHVTLGL